MRLFKKFILLFALLTTWLLAITFNVNGSETLNVIAWPLAATEELTKLLPEFEKETGVRVDMELVPESVVHEKLAIEFAAKTGAYDVAMIGFPQYPEFAHAGFIENLEKYIKEDPDKNWLDLNDFYPGYLDSLRVDDDLYGLPFFLWAGCLMYRKDIFEKYGVEIPKTILGLEEVASKLTMDRDGDGNIDLYGISMRGTKGPFSTASAAFVYSFGGTILDENMKPQLTSPEAIEAVSHYVKLLKDYGPPGSAGYDWMEVQEVFVRDKVAMILEASDYAGRIEDPKVSNVVGLVGYTTMPKEKRPMGYMFTGGWSIVSTSKLKDAAWKFIQWSTNKETQKKLIASGTNTGPVSKTVWESDEFASKHPYLPVLKQALMEAHPNYIPRIDEYTEVILSFTGYVSEAITGSITPKEAMEKANDEIYKILEKAGYYK